MPMNERINERLETLSGHTQPKKGKCNFDGQHTRELLYKLAEGEISIVLSDCYYQDKKMDRRFRSILCKLYRQEFVTSIREKCYLTSKGVEHLLFNTYMGKVKGFQAIHYFDGKVKQKNWRELLKVEL